MSWLSAPPDTHPTDLGGIALGAFFAVAVIVVLWLDHLLAQTDDRSHE